MMNSKIEKQLIDSLKESLNYVNKNSSFYKNLFKQNDFDPQHFHKLDQLPSIPCTTKENLQSNIIDFLCVDKRQIAEWVTTSGTEGEPISFGLSRKDMLRLGQNETLSLSRMGCDEEDIVQLMVTLDKRFMAGLAYFLGINGIAATCVRVGSGSPGLQLDSMSRFQTTAIVAVPSFLLKVIEYAEQKGFDLNKLSVEKILCIGEPIRNKNFELNSLGSRITEKWPKLKLFSTYASTEMSTAVTECEEGIGGHIPTHLVHIEIIDDKGNPVEDGEIGEVCFTTFGIEAMPLVRYRTGDLAVLHTGSCACGDKSPRLSPILGRKKNMLKLKGTTIFPQTIFDALNGIEQLDSHLVILEETDTGLDHVCIHASGKNEGLKKEMIEEHLKAILRVTPEVHIKSKEEIRKSMFPDGSRKPLKLIDKRNPLSLHNV